ncbi:MAG: VOC family protein [Phycisphaerales bacterium]|nr:VOC family protein [Phycisphaerales bacterium]
MGNPVIHWQIVSRKPDELVSFYTKLFGWTVSANNALGYRMLSTGAGRGIDGGVWPAPPEAHAFVQLHVEVSDIADYVARATELGARVIIPAQPLPEGGHMAVLCDPDGVPFVLFQPVAAA